MTTYSFIGDLMAWTAFKIAPQNFKKPITRNDVIIMNFLAFLSVILWTVLFCNLTN